jgi:nondiscriminating aspartyl-tRNA synthetase
MSSLEKSNRILSSQLSQYINQKINISGWLHKKRLLGNLMFIVLRDRHGLIQIVIENSQEIKKLDGLYQGTVLNITGTVRETKQSQFGIEIYNPDILVIVPITTPSPVEIDKPIDHRPEGLNNLFEFRVLNMRNLTENNIWKIQAEISDTIRLFLKSQNFIEFHSPKLLAGSTEGGAEVFKLDYFGKQATLAQSAQFYKQIMVGAYERVFEFGATYRAEPSMTSRHLTEFITLDVEMGFISGIQDIMSVINQMLIIACEEIWKTHERELKSLGATKPVLSQEFPVITLKELHELCFKETQNDFRTEKDPTPFEERWICEYTKQKLGSEAVFITEFPASEMKFYHFRNELNPEVTDRFDLIFRGVEIITGSQREHRYDKLIEQLKASNCNPETPGFKYYLQAFKFGMPPHGGFGLGLERLTQKIIGLNNVKEACIFPRDTGRLAP